MCAQEGTSDAEPPTPCDDERVDADTAEELRALRRRAYGPDGDLENDPAAVVRLAELEELVRPAPPAPAGRSSEGDSATPDGAGISAEAHTPAEATSAEEDPAPPARPGAPPRISTLVAALWVVSVLAVGSLAAATTWALASIPPVSATTGAAQVATLSPEEGPDLDRIFGGPEGTTTYQYLGYAIVHTTRLGLEPGSACLAVMDIGDISSNGESINGPVYYGCSAGPFPVRTALTVSADSPAATRDTYAVGTSLEFVFSSGSVGVFMAPPSPDQGTPDPDSTGGTQ